MYSDALTALLRGVGNCFCSDVSPYQKIIAQTSRPIINSFGTNSKDRTDDLIESVLIRPTPSKPSHSAAFEMRKLYSLNFCLQFCFENNDFPCLKMPPPESCVLFNFEPIFESHKGNYRVHIRLLHFLLEFIAVVHHFSHPLEWCYSEDLTLKYMELLDIQQTYIPGTGKQKVELRSIPMLVRFLS